MKRLLLVAIIISIPLSAFAKDYQPLLNELQNKDLQEISLEQNENITTIWECITSKNQVDITTLITSILYSPKIYADNNSGNIYAVSPNGICAKTDDLEIEIPQIDVIPIIPSLAEESEEPEKSNIVFNVNVKQNPGVKLHIVPDKKAGMCAYGGFDLREGSKQYTIECSFDKKITLYGYLNYKGRELPWKTWELKKNSGYYPAFYSSLIESLINYPNIKNPIFQGKIIKSKLFLPAIPIEIGRHNYGIKSLAITPDGSKIISGEGDKTITVWDINTGNFLKGWSVYESITSVATAITPNGLVVVSSEWSKTIKTWDINSGHILETFGSEENIFSMAIIPNTSKVVLGLGCSKKIIEIRDINSSDLISKITKNGPADIVKFVTVTPDGSKIVAGLLSEIRIWDINSGSLLNTLQGHTDSVYSVAVTPDGAKVVAGSGDDTLRIWDINSGSLLNELKGHTGDVNSVAITPDGSKIVSGSDDGTIRIWDINSGNLLDVLLYGGKVKSVAITPDSSKIVSGGDDGTIKIWDLNKITVHPQIETLLNLYTTTSFQLIKGIFRRLELSKDSCMELKSKNYPELYNSLCGLPGTGQLEKKDTQQDIIIKPLPHYIK